VNPQHTITLLCLACAATIHGTSAYVRAKDVLAKEELSPELYDGLLDALANRKLVRDGGTDTCPVLHTMKKRGILSVNVIKHPEYRAAKKQERTLDYPARKNEMRPLLDALKKQREEIKQKRLANRIAMQLPHDDSENVRHACEVPDDINGEFLRSRVTGKLGNQEVFEACLLYPNKKHPPAILLPVPWLSPDSKKAERVLNKMRREDKNLHGRAGKGSRRLGDYYWTSEEITEDLLHPSGDLTHRDLRTPDGTVWGIRSLPRRACVPTYKLPDRPNVISLDQEIGYDEGNPTTFGDLLTDDMVCKIPMKRAEPEFTLGADLDLAVAHLLYERFQGIGTSDEKCNANRFPSKRAAALAARDMKRERADEIITRVVFFAARRKVGEVTMQELADVLGVDLRTVQRWNERLKDGDPVVMSDEQTEDFIYLMSRVIGTVGRALGNEPLFY